MVAENVDFFVHSLDCRAKGNQPHPIPNELCTTVLTHCRRYNRKPDSIHNAIQRSSEWLNFTVNQYMEAHSYWYVSIYIICSVIVLWAWWKTHVNSISRTHLENVNWFRTHRIWNCVMNVNRPPLRSKLNWESWISAIETGIHCTGVPVRRYADTMSCISRKDGDNVTISKEGKNIDSCNWKLIFHQFWIVANWIYSMRPRCYCCMINIETE